MKNIILFLFACIGVQCIYGQRDDVIQLREVVLSDSKLQQFADGIKVRVLSDSLLTNNSGMLVDNLQYNTAIYFKQNGYGMVTSPSFRGTSAGQTAVVWNGININSQLNGQTDFNTVMAQNLTDISVRSGGGSTQYGTGAIGGSIHLNQTLDFNKSIENRLLLGYGSFNTSSLFYKTDWGNENTSIQLGLGHRSSTNDFRYLGTDRRNENGAFSNQNVDFAMGKLLSSKDLLKFYHNTFIGNRDFSGTLTAPSDDSYRDFNTRSLLEWTHFKKNITQRVKLAYLTERYRYYPNKEREAFSFGASQNVLFNYDYLYRLKKWKFNGLIEVNRVGAEGSSIIQEQRDRLAGILLISRKASDQLAYGFNLRKDWVSDFESPTIFSSDLKYSPSDKYTIKANGSKNFRIPTFNDLYWEGAGANGNFALVPETSWQGELGQTVQLKNFSATLTGFYIATEDLIQWRPDVLGNWSPVNVKDVTQYGLEFETTYRKTYHTDRFEWRNGYAFTNAIDNDTERQLIYVPTHRITSNLSYSHKRWGSFVQTLYNGKVYTTTDHSQSLPNYWVTNLGLTYSLPEIYNTTLQTQVIIGNVFNTAYQNVAFRPMPNRNINFNLNFKF